MMSKRTTDVVAYLSWIGLLAAFVMGDRAASRFHLNQSLTIWLAGTVAGIAGRLLGEESDIPDVTRRSLWERLRGE